MRVSGEHEVRNPFDRLVWTRTYEPMWVNAETIFEAYYLARS
jgi:hypothetical protein